MRNILIIFLVITLFLPTYSNGQKKSVKTQIFESADQMLKNAREAQAEILAPKSYKQALEKYKQAHEDYDKTKSLDNIRIKLNQAQTFFSNAINASKLAKITFAKALAARSDAMESDAAQFAEKQWIEGEQKLLEGTKKQEDGNTKTAQKIAGEAETLYRQAELAAIKANYLQAAWELLDQADKSDVKKKAPETLKNSREMATRSENILNTDRYNTDEARQLASAAKSEVEHAFWITDHVKSYEKKKNSGEALLLDSEDYLKQVADQLDVIPNFKHGPNPVTTKITEKINLLQRTIQVQKRDMEDKDEQIAALMDQVGAMESQLGTLQIEQKTYQVRLEKQRIEREKFARIEKIFTRQEARVLREGNKLIIRLWGLTFPSGKSTIQPTQYGLLSKLKDALAEYPGADVEIHGHTDSRGSDALNQKLSTSRAHSVKEYLIANGIATEQQAKAVGYGETIPIASNETEAGRRKNRRIDLIIEIPKQGN